ncbi:hypothetical protein EJ04DRAFT_144437 [Polyplosphaeria fusca]|uniref:Uncharacterized protein n=1 Tax=Polyplosphaeria fusca TaxID=682080 RepID=A0A9P4R0A4_9PLEO|nr:hypothetical protein EJ04DRAFT_144437 [Polyplosphaeria fusca]
MCIIIPVDHLSCSHTVAIWHHCKLATRSIVGGWEPCTRIRQHGRPILTRKVCINCGGPKIFPKRGGMAEQDGCTSSPEKEESADQYDSGYHSDIMEEDEDDLSVPHDCTMYPPAWTPIYKRRKCQPEQQNIPRSVPSTYHHTRTSSSMSNTSSRRTSWRPNLKRESLPSHSNPVPQRDSSGSELSRFEDALGLARRSAWPSAESSAFSTPLVQATFTKRNGSTLLHPSPPPVDRPESQISQMELEVETLTRTESFASVFSTTSTIELSIRSEPAKRKGSTLLHPSPAEPPTPILRVGPVRKSSTLLHPSSPDISPIVSSTERRTVFPFPAITLPIRSATPSAPSTPSSIGSSSSDSSASTIITFPPSRSQTNYTPIWKDEVEGDQYWSSDHEADTESFHDEEPIVVAKMGHVARASRVNILVHNRSLSSL